MNHLLLRLTTMCPQYDDAGLPHGYPMRSELEVSPRDVRSMQEADAPHVLYDCRTPPEREMAKIEGDSVFIPMQELAERVDELEKYRDAEAPLIVYCHHGVRSLRVAAWLQQQGFENARSMAGGIDGWSHAIDPDVPIY
ncbi:MAG: rhodanese-like domain-containing protein [Planctomycetota bacterium]